MLLDATAPIPRSAPSSSSRELEPKINLLAGLIKVRCLQFYYLSAMEISKASFEMLWRIADAVLETLRETPEGALESAMVQEFEARGFSAKMFYGIVTELENAGLVRWRGNLLFRALLN
jgi:hypothetical protein